MQNRYCTLSMCGPVQLFLVCCADVLAGLNESLKPVVSACHLTLFYDVLFHVCFLHSRRTVGLLAPQSDALLLFPYDISTGDRSAEDGRCSGDHAPQDPKT